MDFEYGSKTGSRRTFGLSAHADKPLGQGKECQEYEVRGRSLSHRPQNKLDGAETQRRLLQRFCTSPKRWERTLAASERKSKGGSRENKEMRDSPSDPRARQRSCSQPTPSASGPHHPASEENGPNACQNTLLPQHQHDKTNKNIPARRDERAHTHTHTHRRAAH